MIIMDTLYTVLTAVIVLSNPIVRRHITEVLFQS